MSRVDAEREAFLDWHLDRSLHAMGAATETDLRMYLTFPRQPAPERRARLCSSPTKKKCGAWLAKVLYK